jgi:NTP pyrophosphatase (non-canonical NTP hydrolase)
VNELEQLRERLRAFARARDWEQFHSPKNVASALIVEAAELLEHFQWLTQDQSRALAPDKLRAVEEEIADVLLYLVRLADLLGVDLMQAAERKLALNERKYPADEVRGSAEKR